MLELKHVFKQFDHRVILNDVNIQFPDCGFIGIQGESGCGKSSLLYILGMLDNEFEGEVYFQGELITNSQVYIQDNISYMMQNKDYISSLTIKENIVLGSQVANYQISKTYLKKIVNQLEIQDLLNQYPSQLSGGQLKRVSIAKALLKQSPILLCDEPTGALHEKQAHEVMKLLQQYSLTNLVVIVSHDPHMLKTYCDSVLTLKEGKLKGRIKKRTCEKIVKKRQYYSLIVYPIRQFLYQKNKVIFLFIFQWIIIVSFFLMITAMNGILQAIEDIEVHSVHSYTMLIERKDNMSFEEPISYPQVQHISYQYHLEQLQMPQELSANLSFLPQNTSHIRLMNGRMPFSHNEILISESLSHKFSLSDTIILTFENNQYVMQIVGILEPSFFQEEEIYCSPLFQEDIAFLKDDYVLIIESNHQESQKIYQELSKDYIVYYDVLERTESYQSLLEFARIVCYVFIGVSLLISLILIRIVLSILYFERKHDVAYLLSLGLKKSKLIFLTFLESCVLAIVIVVGGCLFATLLYFYINHVYVLKDYYHISLLLKPILYCRYDLYIFIFVLYIVMCILATMKPLHIMMKTKMIDILREE